MSFLLGNETRCISPGLTFDNNFSDLEDEDEEERPGSPMASDAARETQRTDTHGFQIDSQDFSSRFTDSSERETHVVVINNNNTRESLAQTTIPSSITDNGPFENTSNPSNQPTTPMADQIADATSNQHAKLPCSYKQGTGQQSFQASNECFNDQRDRPDCLRTNHLETSSMYKSGANPGMSTVSRAGNQDNNSLSETDGPEEKPGMGTVSWANSQADNIHSKTDDPGVKPRMGTVMWAGSPSNNSLSETEVPGAKPGTGTDRWAGSPADNSPSKTGVPGAKPGMGTDRWAGSPADNSLSKTEDEPGVKPGMGTVMWAGNQADNSLSKTDEPVLKLRTNDTVASAVFRWSLEEEDLYGPVTMGGTSHLLEYTDHPSTQASKKCQCFKHTAPSAYMRRSVGTFMDGIINKDKPWPGLTMMSPLASFAKVAKEANVDPAVLMESSDKIGLPLYFPCMQCYEKFGYMKGDGGDDSYYDDPNEPISRVSDNRCKTCGGQVMSVASFGKMLQQIRAKISSQNLVARDSYPDGNCQFSAIVHLLRMDGDFRYTPTSLRYAAVDYLRKNPAAEDGTPLECFLTDNESWAAYLTRMTNEGEWGDHMVLTALSSVLNKKIIIYGGMSGQGETVILPKHMCQTSEKEATQNQSETADEIGSLILGHLGESHYVSFCSNTWQKRLIHKMQQHAKACTQTSQTERFKLPLTHINCLVKQILHLEYLRSYESELINSLLIDEQSKYGFKAIMVGSLVSLMQPKFVSMESMLPDISAFLPSQKQAEEKYNIFCLYQPIDTKVVFQYSEAQRKDVILEDSCETGFYWCVPRLTKMWPEQVVKSRTGRNCLKFFNAELSQNSDYKTFGFVYKFAFQCDWPMLCKDWLHRERKSNWPGMPALQEIVKLGCHVIPLDSYKEHQEIVDEYIPASVQDTDHLWMLSFAVAERQLSHLLCEEQRQCYLLFKMLVDLMTKELELPKSILRTVFFLACENVNQPMWKESPGECLLILLKSLANGLKLRRIPHYFIARRNLLRKMSPSLLQELFERIETLRHQPLISIYILVEENNLMSSEIGTYIDKLIADSYRFVRHGNASKSFQDSILPASVMLMKSLLLQNEYQLASHVIQDLNDLSCRLPGQNMSIADIIKTSNLPLDYQWCMSLYIDIKKNTTLTNELFARNESVHITEVFGPEIMDELPNVVVPSLFSIDKGNLKFVEMAVEILKQAVSKKTVIKSLKYYLETYNNQAGDKLVLDYAMGKPHAAIQCHALVMNLHIVLFNLFQSMGQATEFRSFVPRLKQLTRVQPSSHSQRNLSYILQIIGDEREANDVYFEAPSEGRTSVLSTLSQLLGVEGNDQYY